MAERACVKRLQREFKGLLKEPVPHVVAKPSPSDILEWHYVLEGSQGTPFEGGFYHGKLKFPPEYPYKPPGISMITPNGRFATQKRLCMSMSDFHPETWNPMWSVSSILTGLLSFMMDNSPTTGSLSTSDEEKRRLARASLDFNCQNVTFRKMFPEYIQKQTETESALSEKKAAEQQAAAAAAAAAANPAETAENRRRNKGQNRPLIVPTWLGAILVALLCSIMALPLLSLDLRQQ